jgi:hypothetical protein
MKLSNYIKERGITEVDFSKLIDVKAPSVNRYLRDRVPTPAVMRRIIEATNGDVMPNDFYI